MIGPAAQRLLDELIGLERYERDTPLARSDDGFRVTAAGRPFIRAICAEFDAYLKRDRARHSVAV